MTFRTSASDEAFRAEPRDRLSIAEHVLGLPKGA